MHNTTEVQELFYKVNEVADILQTTPKTIRGYITGKILRAHRLPFKGGYRIHKDDLISFLEGLRLAK
jgi:DNA-binding transcriptional MerR regulator